MISYTPPRSLKSRFLSFSVLCNTLLILLILNSPEIGVTKYYLFGVTNSTHNVLTEFVALVTLFFNHHLLVTSLSA